MLSPNNLPTNNETNNTVFKKWLRSRHVMEMLAISATTLKRYRNQKLLEVYQPIKGGNYLYDADQVSEMIRSNKKE